MKRNWHASHQENLTPGQRAADSIRNKMGSWGFVGIFTLLMAIWMATGGFGIDTAPFILLNLALSTLAGLQGAILLIAAKRADEVSAALAQHDYEVNVTAKAEIENLQLVIGRLENEKHNEMISYLQKIEKKLTQ